MQKQRLGINIPTYVNKNNHHFNFMLMKRTTDGNDDDFFTVQANVVDDNISLYHFIAITLHTYLYYYYLQISKINHSQWSIIIQSVAHDHLERRKVITSTERKTNLSTQLWSSGL